MFYIAATLGMTVAELEDKLTFDEYLGWLEYFAQQAKSADGGTNLLNSPDDLLKGFGL